jgi:hypothetical protein
MLGQNVVAFPMPRRKPGVEPYIWGGDLSALGDRLGIKDLAYLERLLNKEETAPASLARKVAALTGGAVVFEVRKPGRPRRKIEHPLAQWIDANRGGDRAAFAKEIGFSEAYLSAVLSGRELLSIPRAKEIRRLTGISLDDLFPEQEGDGV